MTFYKLDHIGNPKRYYIFKFNSSTPNYDMSIYPVQYLNKTYEFKYYSSNEPILFSSRREAIMKLKHSVKSLKKIKEDRVTDTYISVF